MSQQVVNASDLYKAFFAPGYNELYEKVRKAEEGKSFDNMCFVEYMPFTQGLIAPITITDIKANWHLVYANGEWHIDDWKNDPEEENSMADRMREYLAKWKE